MSLANGLNLNSLGTRALSMGGAFVGLADDFSAIFWNPAGIAQFDKSYFGFYGSDLIPRGSYKLDTVIPSKGSFTLVDAESKTKHYLTGMGAYYHPLTENLVAGIGIYAPSGLGVEWDGADFALITNNNPSIKWMSKVGVITISPAIAYKINDQISIGATLNMNYGMFDLKMYAESAVFPINVPPYFIEVDLGQYEESMNGWGIGATFGVLVKPNEMFSLGVTVRTPSKIKFEGDAKLPNLSFLDLTSKSDLDREITWPLWIAAGVAVKPMKDLTVTADVQFTQWSKLDVIETDYKDTFWKLFMAESGKNKMPLHWEDAFQIRFGAEYLLKNMAFRAGYYRDPAPGPERTLNALLPNFDFNVITVGFGYKMDDLQIDLGFEYLMGKERTVDLLKAAMDPEYESAMPGIHNMAIPVPNISVSYKF